MDSKGKKGKYAVLSCCWGKEKLIKTHRNNLASHEISVLLEDLPILFQEAISLCHRFHIPFIWIDCLCIIQDDEGDWQTESVKMAAYYSNAYLIISATLSPNPTVTFRKNR